MYDDDDQYYFDDLYYEDDLCHETGICLDGVLCHEDDQCQEEESCLDHDPCLEEDVYCEGNLYIEDGFLEAADAPFDRSHASCESTHPPNEPPDTPQVFEGAQKSEADPLSKAPAVTKLLDSHNLLMLSELLLMSLIPFGKPLLSASLVPFGWPDVYLRLRLTAHQQMDIVVSTEAAQCKH